MTAPPAYRHAFVTGAAGFIGSNLVDRLLNAGLSVVGYDKLETGQIEFLADARCSRDFTLVRGDVLDEAKLTRAMAGADIVFHLAANADVRFGLLNPRKDLEQNTIATFNVLEAMRTNGIRDVVFSSTASVYGEATVIPTPEDAAFPIQTSLYGASKLGSEGLICAYCEGYAMRGFIFRFVSILGERYTHGHVFDFYRKLLADPTRLRVLGNGHQRKSYLYVQDCIDAIFTALNKAPHRINILNLGTDDYCEVNDSVRWITEHLGVSPQIEYAGGTRGWIGDSPFILLDTRRMGSLGWSAKVPIRTGIVRTLEWLKANQWVFERRA